MLPTPPAFPISGLCVVDLLADTDAADGDADGDKEEDDEDEDDDNNHLCVVKHSLKSLFSAAHHTCLVYHLHGRRLSTRIIKDYLKMLKMIPCICWCTAP